MTYNEIIKKPGKRIVPRVYYYSGETQISINRDDFIRAKHLYNAKLIGTVMNGLELELKVLVPSTTMYLEITASYGNESAIKTFGPYTLKESPKYQADKKSYTYSLCDAIITTMTDYQPISIVYPCTVFEYFETLVSTLGLTTNILSLPNGDKVMNSDIYDGINFTYRSVLEDIAQANGVLFKIIGTQIQLCELGNTSITINDDILKNTNIDFGEHFGPINSIVLSRSSDSDNIYLRDEESVEEYGLCEFKISDNQLMNDNNRDVYLPALLNQLKGIEYDIFDTALVGYGGFESLQKIQFQTGNKTYTSYVFNNEEIITQGYEESIYTEKPEESTTDYKAADKTDKKINQTYIIVKKQEGEIELLASQTNQIQDSLNNNYYNIEQTNELIQTAETGLTNTFTQSGGNNVLRNTGLWFMQNDSNNPFEYWTGIASQSSNDNASCKTSIILQDGDFEQSQQVANGNYTISFKYQKLIPLATATITINDRVYELTETDVTEFYTGQKDESGEYIVQPLEVSSNQIDIKFTCDTDNAVEIYDLMCNQGTEKSVWSQNQNETTTDTVNISQGITIISNTKNTKFKADADGVRIFDKNDTTNSNPITEFTDKGMTTKEAVIENQATIVGILRQQVGDQIWDCLII